MVKIIDKLKNSKFHLYVPLIISITITINGFVTMIATAIPLLNKMFALHIDNRVSSDLYSLGMQFNIGLGVFMPIVLGYLMILIAKGIYQRKRVFWIIAVVLISLSMIADYIQDHHFSYNLTFVVHSIEIVLLLTFAKVFNKRVQRRVSFYQVILAMTFLLAITYSVLGIYYLRDEYNGINTITDALYFTLVTFSTVGYGDISPITQQAKIFTMTVMLLGIGIFAAIVTVVASSIIAKIVDKFKIKDGAMFMKNHIVICGYTEISKYILNQHNNLITDIIVIQENYKDKFISITEKDDKNFIDAESSNFEALKQANISKAKSIMILNDKDSDNILTLLSIKEYLKVNVPNQMPQISIKLDKEENINIANNIGVDQIVSPAKKVAEMLMTKHELT